MKNPFSRFNTARIIIALLIVCFALVPHRAYSQEEKLPRLVIERPEEAGIGFFDYFEDVNELITIDIRGISVWDIENGGLLQFYPMEKFGGYAVESVSLSKSGRYMAVGCGNNRMFVYDRDRDEIVFEHSISPIPAPESVWGWFSKQENILIITYGLSHMEVWDVLSNQQLFTDFRSRGGRARQVDFYDNGDWFLVYGTVYSIMMEEPVFHVELPQSYLMEDNRFILGVRFGRIEGTNYPQIVRHDAMTGELLAEHGPILELDPIIRFAPDGNHAIIAKSRLEPENEEIRDVELFNVTDSSISPTGRFVSAQRASYPVFEMKFFHGGKTLAISSGPRLYIYDTSDLITDVPDSEMHED